MGAVAIDNVSSGIYGGVGKLFDIAPTFAHKHLRSVGHMLV